MSTPTQSFLQGEIDAFDITFFENWMCDEWPNWSFFFSFFGTFVGSICWLSFRKKLGEKTRAVLELERRLDGIPSRDQLNRFDSIQGSVQSIGFHPGINLINWIKSRDQLDRFYSIQGSNEYIWFHPGISSIY